MNCKSSTPVSRLSGWRQDARGRGRYAPKLIHPPPSRRSARWFQAPCRRQPAGRFLLWGWWRRCFLHPSDGKRGLKALPCVRCRTQAALGPAHNRQLGNRKGYSPAFSESRRQARGSRRACVAVGDQPTGAYALHSRSRSGSGFAFASRDRRHPGLSARPARRAIAWLQIHLRIPPVLFDVSISRAGLRSSSLSCKSWLVVSRSWPQHYYTASSGSLSAADLMRLISSLLCFLAERVGFEPTVRC